MLTAGELDVGWENGQTVIRKEGKHKKFVKKLEQVCYNAAMGRARGQTTYFVTERAVFKVGTEGLELIEVAPGVDVECDVIANMEFRPTISPNLKTMDARIFKPELMGLVDDLSAKPKQYRSQRVMKWHQDRLKR